MNQRFCTAFDKMEMICFLTLLGMTKRDYPTSARFQTTGNTVALFKFSKTAKVQGKNFKFHVFRRTTLQIVPTLYPATAISSCI